jgi:pimeloyl-ACP methyl ester carboxylesterase
MFTVASHGDGAVILNVNFDSTKRVTKSAKSLVRCHRYIGPVGRRRGDPAVVPSANGSDLLNPQAKLPNHNATVDPALIAPIRCLNGAAPSGSADRRMRRFDLQGAGVRLSCLDYGGAGAPPILFIHGGAAHAHWWDFVGQRLDGSYRSFSIDLRGHGDSERPADGDYSVESHIADLAAALRTWGHGKPVLAAHSGGCFVALPYAAAHPESVAAMAIVEPRVHWPRELLERATRRNERPHRRFASLQEACASYRFIFPPIGASPELLDHVARHSFRQEPDGMWVNKTERLSMAGIVHISVMEYAAKLRCPTLVIRGDRSVHLSEEDAVKLTALAHAGPAVVISNAQHNVMLDNPVEVASALRSFVGSLKGR